MRETYETDITIAKIGLTYLGDIDLKGVMIRDHHQDTLIYASHIETSIVSAHKIIQGKPKLGTVHINDPVFKMKIYKDETSDNLMTFIRKFKSQNPTTSSGDFLFQTGNIEIANGYYSFKDENLQNPDVVYYKHIELNAERLIIDNSDVNLEITHLSFLDNWGLDVTDLKTHFVYKPDSMEFCGFQMKTPFSQINSEIIFEYPPGGLVHFIDSVKIKAAFKKSNISTNDLRPFYKEFGRNQMISISKLDMNGTLNNFMVKNANLKAMNHTSLKGDLHIRNAATNLSKFSVDGRYKKLNSSYYDLIRLLPRILGKSLPNELSELGHVRAKGEALITTKSVDVDMSFYTRLGNMNAFVLLESLNNLKQTTYNGNIISNGFDLGKLLDKKLLGKASFNIHIDGKGFFKKALHTKIEGDINKLEFRGYTYNAIKVLGSLDNQIFDGTLKVNDPNIKFVFNGIADLTQEINNYDFEAKVDHLDLKKLNFFTRDEVAVFNGDVLMNMKGTNINNAYGTISFEKTLYTNQNASYYFDDFDIKASFDKDSTRTITVNSPDIIEGKINGIFRVENVIDLFKNSIGSLYTNFKPSEVTKGEFMNFNFKIYNTIVDVFFPEIQFAPNTLIKGSVESNNSEFKLNFRSPSIKAFGNSMDNISIQVDNKNPLFNTYIAIDSIRTSQYKVSDFNLINVTMKDTLFMRSEFKGGKNNKDDFNLELYYTINEESKSVIGLRKSKIIFKDYEWSLNQKQQDHDNKIIFDNDLKNIQIDNISLSHNNEEIKVFGYTEGNYKKDIQATFTNVNLNKVTPNIESLDFNGSINGILKIDQIAGKYSPKSVITIDDFFMNGKDLGKFIFKASGNEDLTQFDVLGEVENDQRKTFELEGSLSSTNSNLDLDIDISLNKFDLSTISPLGGIVLSDIRGEALGKVSIEGNFKKPSINGALVFNKTGLKIPYLNVDLDFEEWSKIRFINKRLYFDDINVVDTKYNTQAILGGFMDHYSFLDWELGLEVKAKERFLVLDTEGDEESLYYGTAFIKGDTTIKGPIDALVIDVIATTEKGTIFKIPLNETESLGDNSYIHFLTPDEKQARLEGREIILEDLSGLELNFDLDVNKNAEVEIVVDQNTGSSLRGRGAGTLLIEINTNGKFKMWGDFVAYEGTYNFRYGAFVEKVFTVKDGGTIVWDGNPTRAILDLGAIYKTSANPAVLLENSTINRKVPVEVIVQLNGELIQPDLNFDIKFPNLSSVVKNELEYQIGDQSSRELQALSLVTQGQFYSDAMLGQNVITGNLVERASSLVNDIFSGKDDKFKIGLNYEQGDRIQNQQSTDQFGVTVSTQINNNIVINGRVGVPVGGVNESTVVGDVEVEYLFNKDGSLRGKIFNRQNDIQFIGELQGYRQGAGLSYSVDFNNFRELLRKVFKTNQQSKDSIQSTLKKLK